MISQTAEVTKTFQVMGGKFKIIAVGVPESALDLVGNLLVSLEQKWTRFRPDSELSTLNNSEGKAVELSDMTIKLIKAMQRSSKITKGYFDPTTLPILVNSGFAASRTNSNYVTKLPNSASWPGNLADIKINGNLVSLPTGTVLDAGGIGKGLAADLALALLLDLGASGALVNANGDIAMSGESPQAGAWIIGIEDPLDEKVELEQVRIVNGAIATSSKVHQTWINDGIKTHHIVNPLTGSTAVTSVLSASVICSSCADAEALTKVPFTIEINAALQLIEQAGAECMVVDNEYKIHKTKGWDKFR